MQELTELISFLNRGEISLILNFYKSPKRGIGGEAKRRLELFELIRQKKVYTDEEACQIIFSTKPDSNFSQLKKRVKKDVLNIVLLQEASSKDATPYVQATIECRRKLIAGDILLARGAYTVAMSILKDASVLALKYELPAEQILITDSIRTHMGAKKGIREYEKHRKYIDEQFQLLTNILNAKDNCKHIGLSNMFQKNREKEYEEYARVATNTTKKIYKESNSPNVGYWYLRTSLYYHLIAKNYEGALDVAKQLLKLVETEVAVNSFAQRGFANMQIAVVFLELHKNKDAAHYAEKALLCYSHTVITYLTALEILFVACIYMNDLTKAANTIDAAFKHPHLQKNVFQLSKWTFYKANLQFSQGLFIESMKTLNKERGVLMKDASGWLFGYKLLELMNLLETERDEFLAYRLTAFKQLLIRQKLKNITRYKTIYKIIEALVKYHDRDFKTVLKNHNRSINLLKEGQGDYRWDPMSFEIIRFDTWLINKAK